MNLAPQTELFKLKPLFEDIVKEMNGRVTAAEAIVKIDRAYTGKYMSVFTDDVNSPNHVLILAHYPGMFSSGFVCTVYMVYSRPQKRTTQAADLMFAKIEEYARQHRCEEIMGSAWKFRGARGIDSMWSSRGYELQETTYVKLL